MAVHDYGCKGCGGRLIIVHNYCPHCGMQLANAWMDDIWGPGWTETYKSTTTTKPLTHRILQRLKVLGQTGEVPIELCLRA